MKPTRTSTLHIRPASVIMHAVIDPAGSTVGKAVRGHFRDRMALSKIPARSLCLSYCFIREIIVGESERKRREGLLKPNDPDSCYHLSISAPCGGQVVLHHAVKPHPPHQPPPVSPELFMRGSDPYPFVCIFLRLYLRLLAVLVHCWAATSFPVKSELLPFTWYGTIPWVYSSLLQSVASGLQIQICLNPTQPNLLRDVAPMPCCPSSVNPLSTIFDRCSLRYRSTSTCSGPWAVGYVPSR